MIQRLDIEGIHLKVDDNLNKYVYRKLANLDKYLSKKIKESIHMEVILKEIKSKDKNNCICEVNLYLPKEKINLKESTVNIYAAIDIVEAKLKLKIHEYSDKHNLAKIHRRVLKKILHRSF